MQKRQPQQRRVLRQVLVLALAAPLFGAPEAAAQFNARGRRAPARPQRTPSAERAPDKAEASEPATRRLVPQKSDTASRDDQLIERYRRLIVERPGEEVPLKRLVQLTRERDGSLDDLLLSIEKQAKDSSGSERYGALVAWGAVLLENGKATEAVEPLRRASETMPDRAPAWMWLGAAEQALGRLDEAARSYERAIPSLSGPDRLAALRDLRRLRLDANDLEGARQAHGELLKLSVSSAFVRGELGRELAARGLKDEAIAEFRGNVEAASGDARARLVALNDLGEALVDAGQSDEAIVILNQAAGLAHGQPGRLHAIELRLAEAHEARGTLDEYLTTLKKRASTGPTLTLLGRLYEQEGRTDEAIAAYERALERDRRDVDTRLRLVRLLELTGRLELASEELGRLAQASPGDVPIVSRYLSMLLAQGKREAAVSQWDRLERSTRRDPEAGLVLVDLAERLGEPERAKRVLERLAQQAQATPRFFVELGSRYFKRNEPERALEAWEHIKQVHRDPAAGLVMYGEVLIDHGFSERGLLAIAEGVEKNPDDLSARKSLGLSYERIASTHQGQAASAYEVKAIATYASLLEREATGATASFARRHLVRLWHRRGELGREVARLRRAIDDENPDIDQLRLLAEAEHKLGDRRAALGTWTRVLGVRAGDQEALTALVTLHQAGGEHQRAIDTLARLVEADPARARHYYERMARAARAHGDREKALEYAERAAERSAQDPTALTRLAELYLAEAKTEAAENALRRALSQDPTLEESSLLLADILARSGRANEAFDRLSQILWTTRAPGTLMTAGRRLLSLSQVVHRDLELEDLLRKLSIARPQSEEIQNLLLDTLASELAPRQLTVRYGRAPEAEQAREELSAIASRCRGPLLSALNAENPRRQSLALTLLGYDDDATTQSALIAFAESHHDLTARTTALDSLRNVQVPELVDRLEQLVLGSGRATSGALSGAAMRALHRGDPDATRESLVHIVEESTAWEIQALGLLGLSHHDRLDLGRRRRMAELAADLATNPGAPVSARKAALLAWGRFAPRDSNGTETRSAMVMVTSDAPIGLRVAQLAALALAAPHGRKLDQWPAESQRYLLEQLLDPSADVRQAATLSAAGVRPQPDRWVTTSTTLGQLVDGELSAWLQTEPPPSHREELLDVIGPRLVEEARASLVASRAQAGPVLDRLAPGELLHPLRSGLLPELERLARPGSPLRIEALALLSPSDSPESAQLLLRALLETPGPSQRVERPDRPLEVILASLAQAPTEEDVAFVEVVEEKLGSCCSEEHAWYAAYRLVTFHAAVLQRGTPEAQRRSRAALERLAQHPSRFVARAARQEAGTSPAQGRQAGTSPAQGREAGTSAATTNDSVGEPSTPSPPSKPTVAGDSTDPPR